MDNVAKSSNFLLDTLSEDLIAKITNQVVGTGKINCCRFTFLIDVMDAIRLAATSTVLKNAIASELREHTVVVNTDSLEAEREYVAIARDVIQDIEVWDDIPGHLQGTLRTLFSGHSVQSVDIPATQNSLLAVKGLQNIRNLRLTVGSYTDQALLVEVLSTVNVETLSIICQFNPKIDDDYTCFFSNTRFFNSKQNAIARTCPGINTICLDCECYHKLLGNFGSDIAADLPDHPIVELIERLPKLREVSFYYDGPASSALTSALRKVPKVHVRSMETGYNLAGTIGTAVRSIYYIRTPSTRDLLSLRECRRMDIFRTAISPRNILDLTRTIEAMPYLRQLELVSTGDAEPEIRACNHETHCECEKYYSSLLLVVRRAPALEVLVLKNLRFPVAAVSAALQHLGNRLRKFTVRFPMILSEEEGLQNRLSLVVESLARFNRSIRSVELFDRVLHEMSKTTIPSFYGLVLELHSSLRKLRSSCHHLTMPDYSCEELFELLGEYDEEDDF